MNTKTILVVFCVLIGVLLVSADDRDYQRSVVKTSSSKNHVEFRSKRRDESSKEELRFFVGYESELRVRVRYVLKDANTKVDNQYSVAFTSLDTVTTAGNLVSSVNFASISWKDVAINTTGGNSDVVVESQDGSVKMISHIVSDVTKIGEVPVRPTSLKFDIEFNKTTTDFLRLNARVFSSEKLMNDDKSDESREGFTKTREKQVNFGQGVGFFSWEESAVIGGRDIFVNNTKIESAKGNDSDDDDSDNSNDDEDDDDNQEGEGRGKGHIGMNGNIAFTFQTNQVGKLVWDPKLAVSTETSSANASFAAVLSFLLILCALSF